MYTWTHLVKNYYTTEKTIGKHFIAFFFAHSRPFRPFVYYRTNANKLICCGKHYLHPISFFRLYDFLCIYGMTLIYVVNSERGAYLSFFAMPMSFLTNRWNIYSKHGVSLRKYIFAAGSYTAQSMCESFDLVARAPEHDNDITFSC